MWSVLEVIMKLPIFVLVSCSSPVFPLHFLLIYSEFSGRDTKSHLRNAEPDSESKICHGVMEVFILKKALSQNSYKNTNEITQDFLNFLFHLHLRVGMVQSLA